MQRRTNISRLDYGNTHAWWVRFHRGYDADGRRLVVSKVFSDFPHGGRRAALRAAISWRDRTQKSLPPRLRGGTREAPPGHGYVRRTEIQHRSGSSSDVWVAWIRLDGGPRSGASTSRSVAKWGVRGAKLECERWLEQRRRQLASLRAGAPGRS